MVSVVVLVTELDLPSLDINQLHFVGGSKTHVCAFAGVDIPNDRLNERPQISRSAMMHFEHNGSVAIVFNRHSFSELVCRGHLEQKLIVNREKSRIVTRGIRPFNPLGLPEDRRSGTVTLKVR